MLPQLKMSLVLNSSTEMGTPEHYKVLSYPPFAVMCVSEFRSLF